MSQTNELTTNEITNQECQLILNHLFREGIFAWRQSMGAIPIVKDSFVVGFRKAGKSGQPDIVGILKPYGQYLGIEQKTEGKKSKDRLSDVQIGFHKQARAAGGLILVVKDYADFLEQWEAIKNPTGSPC